MTTAPQLTADRHDDLATTVRGRSARAADPVRAAVVGRVPWVVYFDLPTGQVSFHSVTRGMGPDYSAPWDGSRNASALRIESAISAVVAGPTPVACSPVSRQQDRVMEAQA
jgi:hypothetical protein